MAEDPTFRVKTDQADRPGRHRRHGRAAPRDHRRPPEARVQRRGERRPPQVAYKETLTRPADGEMKYAKQTGGRGQYGHAKIHLYPGEPGAGYVFENEITRRRDSEGIHQADRRRDQGSADARRARRLPDGRRADRALRRLVPRRRLVGNGVQDRRIDGVPGRREEGQAGAARAGDARRGRRARRSTWATSWATSSSRRGQIQSQEDRGGTQIINARVPLSEMFGYATDLRSRTQGRATYSMHFDRYEQAPNNVSEEVVARVQGK